MAKATFGFLADAGNAAAKRVERRFTRRSADCSHACADGTPSVILFRNRETQESGDQQNIKKLEGGKERPRRAATVNTQSATAAVSGGRAEKPRVIQLTYANCWCPPRYVSNRDCTAGQHVWMPPRVRACQAYHSWTYPR